MEKGKHETERMGHFYCLYFNWLALQDYPFERNSNWIIFATPPPDDNNISGALMWPPPEARPLTSYCVLGNSREGSFIILEMLVKQKWHGFGRQYMDVLVKNSLNSSYVPKLAALLAFGSSGVCSVGGGDGGGASSGLM